MNLTISLTQATIEQIMKAHNFVFYLSRKMVFDISCKVSDKEIRKRSKTLCQDTCDLVRISYFPLKVPNVVDINASSGSFISFQRNSFDFAVG